MTCCICGTGYIGKDILIYGCISCGRGFSENTKRTRGLKKVVSEYVSNKVRQKLSKKYSIPLERTELTLRGLKSS